LKRLAEIVLPAAKAIALFGFEVNA